MNGYENSPLLYMDRAGFLIEICCSPAIIGAFHPRYPAAGHLDPDSPGTRLLLLALGKSRDDLRRLNLLPNHCMLRMSCNGVHVVTTEANSDLFYAADEDFFGPILRSPIGRHILRNLYAGLYLDLDNLRKVPVAWLVLPLIGNIQKRGTCIPCTKCDDCREQENCLWDQFVDYPRGKYQFINKNSNTYAGTVARACCDEDMIKVPGGIEKAWGWNDTPNPDVPHLPLPFVRLLGELRHIFVSDV